MAIQQLLESFLVLAKHFAARMAFELERQEIPQFSAEAIEALESYAWPGNVRELKNVVERAVYRSDSFQITHINFDPFHPSFAVGVAHKDENQPKTKPEIIEFNELLEKPLKEALWELKVHLLEKALKKAKYNQKAASALLGLTYHQFRGLYRQYQAQSK